METRLLSVIAKTRKGGSAGSDFGSESEFGSDDDLGGGNCGCGGNGGCH